MSNLIRHIVEKSASDVQFSDLQIEVDQPVMWRRPGGWEETGYGIAEMTDVIQVLNAIDNNYKTILRQGHAIDRAIDLSTVRLRCNAYQTKGGKGVAITIRKVPIEAPTLGQLKLPAQVTRFASMPKGLLLVSGATGSGKTTTISALVREINETRAAHIITIEEPIEYQFKRNKSIITQREVGPHSDCSSFSSGLKEALRQRPDVIVVGEIRDADTAETAVRAAESGHYVMATVHARSAMGAIQKMLSFAPQETNSRALTLSNTLCGVISQALIPSIDHQRFIPAVEMITVADNETAGMIADLSKHRQLEEKLKANQLPGGMYLNTVLKKMIAEGLINKRDAVAASYAPEELGFS